MTTTPALTPTDVFERVEALVPRIAERAPEAEQLRQLPEATIADIEGNDLFRLIVPTSLGGHGLNVSTLFHSTRRMAHGCVSTAWTISFLMMHNWLLTRFSDAAITEFFAGDKPWALAATPTAPTGTYTLDGDDFLLTGGWEWATGIQHADWVVVHAVNPDIDFGNRFFAVPIAEAIIDDVWHTSGMRGTGSNLVRFEGCRVPAHRSITAREFIEPGRQIAGDALAGLPMAPVLALSAAAPAVGAAEAAVDLYRERIKKRVLAYSLGDKAVEQPAAQMRLASVMSELSAARLQWDAAVTEVDDAAARGERLSIDRRAALRLAASDTVRRCRAVINEVAVGAGASVYYESAAFQRLQRDVEMLKGHVIFDWDRTTELAGKIALGLEPKLGDML